MSKYQALKDTVGAAILTGISEADWLKEATPATISAILADLERAEKALKVARAYIARYGYTGEQLAAIDAALSQIAGGGEKA